MKAFTFEEREREDKCIFDSLSLSLSPLSCQINRELGPVCNIVDGGSRKNEDDIVDQRLAKSLPGISEVCKVIAKNSRSRKESREKSYRFRYLQKKDVSRYPAVEFREEPPS